MPKGITLEQFQTALRAHQFKNSGAQPRPEELPVFIESSAQLAAKRSERLRKMKRQKLFGY